MKHNAYIKLVTMKKDKINKVIDDLVNSVITTEQAKQKLFVLYSVSTCYRCGTDEAILICDNCKQELEEEKNNEC